MPGVRFAVLAHARSATNAALSAAAASLGVGGDLLSPRDALRLLGPGDVALARLDVREGLDGIESGSPELERLACAGVEVLNTPSALAAAHDKLLTSRVLRLNGWFREHGVLAQELVPPLGWDLRIVVAGGRVVGATRRFAAPGEWRTNVALGGRNERVAPPPIARTLALSAAAAIRGDLVGVDLLPTSTGYVISELNGAVDFRAQYALDDGDVYEETVLQLLRTAAERRSLAAVGA